MDTLIQFIANTLGISPDAAEGSIAVVFLSLILYLMKILWNMLRLLKNADERDERQTTLEQTLVNFAIQSMNSYNKNTETIVANTEAIRKVVEVLDEIRKSFSDIPDTLAAVVGSIEALTEHSEATKPVLDDIKNNLIKTSETVVIIKDFNGNDMIKFTARPNEKGELVVEFNSIVDTANNG